MTKAALIIDLKNLLGPGTDVDATGLTTWLNDAYMFMVDEIAKVNPDFFLNADTSATVSGQQEYTLPSDFEKAKMVNIKAGGEWYRARALQSLNQIPVLNDSSTFGVSVANPFYYIIGNEIGFLPIPTESTAGGIKLWYNYTPSELSADSDIPAFPPKYHHILKFGAMANYLDRDGESAKASNMRQYFERRVAEMVESMSTNQQDSPKSIVVTTDQDLYY